MTDTHCFLSGDRYFLTSIFVPQKTDQMSAEFWLFCAFFHYVLQNISDFTRLFKLFLSFWLVQHTQYYRITGYYIIIPSYYDKVVIVTMQISNCRKFDVLLSWNLYPNLVQL